MKTLALLFCLIYSLPSGADVPVAKDAERFFAIGPSGMLLHSISVQKVLDGFEPGETWKDKFVKVPISHLKDTGLSKGSTLQIVRVSEGKLVHSEHRVGQDVWIFLSKKDDDSIEASQRNNLQYDQMTLLLDEEKDVRKFMENRSNNVSERLNSHISNGFAYAGTARKFQSSNQVLIAFDELARSSPEYKNKNFVEVPLTKQGEWIKSSKVNGHDIIMVKTIYVEGVAARKKALGSMIPVEAIRTFVKSKDGSSEMIDDSGANIRVSDAIVGTKLVWMHTMDTSGEVGCPILYLFSDKLIDKVPLRCF